MSLNMQRYPASPTGKVKHCFLSAERFRPDVEYVPHFYFEAKIDFADVRSGLRDTQSVSNAMHICPLYEEALWTEDMVLAVDPTSIRTPVPQQAKLRPLPEFLDAGSIAQAETRYLHYLMRSFKMRFHRNFALNIYSGPGETLADFTVRCIELLSGPFRQDLDNLHDVFERRIGQIKGKCLKPNEWGELDPQHRASQLKSILHKFSERIAQLFLSAELNLKLVPSAPPPDSSDQLELEERLHSLELEALRAIDRLSSVYQEKVRNIDEYIVHPNLKDIYLVRTCILWMPAEEQSR